MSSGLHVEKNAKTQEVKPSPLAEKRPEPGINRDHSSSDSDSSEAHFTLMQQNSQPEAEESRISKAEKLQPKLG
jgi:hypothetical protein